MDDKQLAKVENETEMLTEDDDNNDNDDNTDGKMDVSCPSPTSTSHSPRQPDAIPSATAALGTSPVKFVQLNDVMNAAEQFQRLYLAHEIAFNRDFKVKEPAGAGSPRQLVSDADYVVHSSPRHAALAKEIRQTFHRAFWQMLEESLSQDEPDYTRAICLLEEIKTELLDMLLPYSKSLRTQINEVLDTDLIRQQAEHKTLDVREYAEFIVETMGKMCSTERDGQIDELRRLCRDFNGNVVELYREIFRVIDLMKTDMANFTVKLFRPLVQQHSISYERQKFDDFVNAQRSFGVDGLKLTREWLRRVVEQLIGRFRESPTSIDLPLTLNDILHEAFVCLIGDESELTARQCPETLLADLQRFQSWYSTIRRLCIVCSVVLMTSNLVGPPMASQSAAKQSIKRTVLDLLIAADNTSKQKAESTSSSENEVESSRKPNEETMKTISENVLGLVDDTLQKMDGPQLAETRRQLIRSQILRAGDGDNAIFRLVRNRFLSFVKTALRQSPTAIVMLANPQWADQPTGSKAASTSSDSHRLQIPPGLSCVESELLSITGDVVRIAQHNVIVFDEHYQRLVRSELGRAFGGVWPDRFYREVVVEGS